MPRKSPIFLCPSIIDFHFVKYFEVKIKDGRSVCVKVRGWSGRFKLFSLKERAGAWERDQIA